MNSPICVLVRDIEACWMTFTWNSQLFRVAYNEDSPFCTHYLYKLNRWERVPEMSPPMMVLAEWIVANQ
jgi:hypothetical protein